MNKDAETLADINNMSTDFIPLLSTNTLQRAGFSPTADDSGRSPSRQTFQATVQHSEKIDSGYRLTLEQQGKTIHVDTPRHHPPGQILTLQLDTESDGEFRLTVINATTPPKTSPTVTDPRHVLSQVSADWLAQLNSRVSDGSRPITTLPFAQAALPSAIQEWLVSRHLLNPQHSEQQTTARHTYLDTLTSLPNNRPATATSHTPMSVGRLLTTLSTATEVPSEVRTLLHAFLQQRPQALTAETVRTMVQQSGIFYEHQLLQQIVTTPTKGSTQSNLAHTFQTLWQKTTTLMSSAAASSAPASAPPIQLTESVGASRPHGIADVLQRIKQQLNATTLRSGSAESEPKPLADDAPRSPSMPLSSGLTQDIKAVLANAIHRWQQALMTAPNNAALPILLQQLQTQNGPRPDGLMQLQTLLASIEIEQHQALQRDSDQSQWQTTLLWREGEQWREARLQRWPEEENATQDGQAKQVRWRLNLHFDLERLGPLDVELDLRLPTIAATFWSMNATSLSLVHAALQPLKARLQTMGVDVQHLQVRHGQLPIQRQNRIEHHLVDVHT